MKKVLFIGPVFYSYQNDIIKEIEETLPARVDFIPYTNFGNLKRRFFRYFFKYDDYVVKSVRNRVRKQVNKKTDYDYVFVLKGGFLEPDLIKLMRKHLTNACFLYYNWDSFERNPRGYSIYRLFDRRFSFDRKDCEENNDLNYLPMFHSFGDTPPKLLQPKFDLLFVGNRSPCRFEFIKEINNQSKSLQLRFKCHMPTGPGQYLRERFIRKDDIYKLSAWTILDYSGYMHLFRQSRSILDIENPRQTGLTMRTIEALAAGIKLITTNKYIAKEPFFTETNVMIVDRKRPIMDPDFIKSDFEPMPGFFEKYSLKSWIKTLFDL